MSRRPKIEEALKKAESRYELVHAAVRRTVQLLKDGDDLFIRKDDELYKKTFAAIEDVAEGKVKIVKREEIEEKKEE
ncbi:MAG TPA: DNA-directed RNA polymerase subunit omega [Aquificaceae bacterium]|nr:DNA-directed RNA polymerase subunit omega [Aquificaceae bacterium]